MATISKFYLHDAATTNTGTMPTGAFVADNFTGDADGDADGTTRNARLTNDVIGVLETSAVITFAATSGVNQRRGFRRFVSPPLAARTFAAADGTWTFSFACAESNTNHSGFFYLDGYLWRPSTGLRVGTVFMNPTFSLTATTKAANSATGNWNGTQAILDGDIIVFEVGDAATQSMAVAYTSTFYYDGTTEASTVSCASFVTPPAALTLFTAAVPATPLPLHQSVPFYPRASRPS